jgi:hypothetical protein
MKVEIEVEEYNDSNGLMLKWEKGFFVEVKNECDEIIISANKEGLYSFARHFLTLAQDTVKEGTHIHLDEYNSLEEESIDLIIQKIK